MTAQPPDEPQQWRPSEPPFDPPSGGDAGHSGPSSPNSPGPTPEASFDPYRFGPPAHPIDPAYAPPGYVPPPPPPPPAPGPPPGQPYGAQQFPGGPSGYPPPGYPPPGYPPPGHQPPGYQPPPPYGQAPYGQPQYGQPYAYGAPANPYAAAQKPTNGLAITALVLGIVAFVLSWIPFFDALIIVPGIVFGIIGITTANKRGGLGKSLAIIGLCLALVAAVICVVWSAYVVNNCSRTTDAFGHESTSCSFGNSGDSED